MDDGRWVGWMIGELGKKNVNEKKKWILKASYGGKEQKERGGRRGKVGGIDGKTKMVGSEGQ